MAPLDFLTMPRSEQKLYSSDTLPAFHFLHQHGCHQDAGKNHDDALQMVWLNSLTQKNDGKDGAEHRHEVDKNSGPVRPDNPDGPIPENKSKYRGKECDEKWLSEPLSIV